MVVEVVCVFIYVTITSSTLLDLVIINNPNAALSCDVVPQEVADHDLISIAVDISKPKRIPVVRTFRHLRNYNKDDFCFKIFQNNELFNLILDTDDVNRQVDIYSSAFTDCLDECAPYVTKEIRRPHTPWMNDDLKEAMKLRNEAQERLKFDRINIALQEQYKREKKHVKTLIAKTKTQY